MAFIRNVSVIWIASLLVPVTALAQDVIPRFENISVNEGLSQSSVYSVLQDHKGFMWFGTADGLNRYDGQEIRIFKRNSPGAMANSNFVRGSLCEDRAGNIWFSNETGIYFYDQRKEKILTAYSFRDNASAKLFYTITTERENVWLGTPLDGLVRFSMISKEIKYFPYPFLTDAYRIVADWTALGSQIVCTDPATSTMYRFDLGKETFKRISEFSGRQIQGEGERLYLFSPGQLNVYDSLLRNTGTVKLPSFIQGIRSVLEDHFGRIWIVTSGSGLYCHIPKDQKTFLYRRDNATAKALPSDIVTRVYADRADNLWVGTDGGGVARLDLKPPKFNLFPLNESDYPLLKDYFTKCFLEDDAGRIWFGTHHIGFVIFNPATGTATQYVNDPQRPGSLPGNIVGAMFRDRDGNLWIGHNRGISLFAEDRQEFKTVLLTPKPYLNPLTSFVYRIIQRRNGDLVAATSEGLVVFSSRPDRYGNFRGVFPERTTWTSLITDVMEASDGTLWFTSPINGLFHSIDRDGIFQRTEKYFSSMDLRAICRDGRYDSILWIGSGQGLIRFNTVSKSSRIFDERSGLSNSFIYGVLEDAAHNFWLSTNGGLSYLNPTTSSVQNFSVNDGLQSNEFNTGAYYKGPSGNFYFGGIKGFNWFHSANVHPSRHKPGVAITAIAINDVPYQKDSLFQTEKTLDLRYDENSLTFQFAALDFTRPQANKIEYWLHGWDKDWVTSPSKTVRYSNLPAGKYALAVKSFNSSGAPSVEEKLAIVIHAPFWQQLWFYILVGSFLVGLMVMAVLQIIRVKVRDRIRQLEKKLAIDAERMRISKDMHDEIGSGLTHIALLSELISTQQKSAQQMKSEVGIISSTAQRLVQSMGEIIWVTHPHNDTIASLLAYLREQTRLYFEPFRVDYVIDFPEQVPHITLSNVQRRNLFLVTKESLNNALKHARATAITFSLRIEDLTLSFEVVDNGQGFSRGIARNNSHGFKNMKSRMEEIGGKFEILSEPGRGTRVRYGMPFLPE